MPLYVIIAIDRPGRLDVRKMTRPKHLEHLETLGHCIVTAGPFTSEDGTPCGSMLVIEANNLEEVESMAANDPYTIAGLFESVTVRPWKHIVGSGLKAMSLK